MIVGAFRLLLRSCTRLSGALRGGAGLDSSGEAATNVCPEDWYKIEASLEPASVDDGPGTSMTFSNGLGEIGPVRD